MNKFLTAIIFCLASVGPLLSQDDKEDLKDLIQSFSNFEYSEVISEASQLINNKNHFTKPELIEIYRMKGVAHFSLSDEQQARSNFIEILKVDSSYELNPSNTSPKIVSFFNKVKNLYLLSMNGKQDKPVLVIHDTLYVEVPVKVRDTFYEYRLKQAFLRSVFIPGTGHLYLEDNFKSWALTALSVASITAGVLYIIDTNKKEREYLQETDINAAAGKYNDYNFSYRMRNLAFISYATLWLYSQFDLLFFSEGENSTVLSYIPGLRLQPNIGFSLSYKINL